MHRALIVVLTLAAAALFSLPALACEKSQTVTADAAPAAADVTLASATLSLKNVSCAGCHVPIREQLTAIDGVKAVLSDENDHTTLTVQYTKGTVTHEQLQAAVKKAGYECEVSDPVATNS